MMQNKTRLQPSGDSRKPESNVTNISMKTTERWFEFGNDIKKNNNFKTETGNIRFKLSKENGTDSAISLMFRAD